MGRHKLNKQEQILSNLSVSGEWKIHRIEIDVENNYADIHMSCYSMDGELFKSKVYPVDIDTRVQVFEKLYNALLAKVKDAHNIHGEVLDDNSIDTVNSDSLVTTRLTLRDVWIREQRKPEDYIVYNLARGKNWRTAVSSLSSEEMLALYNNDEDYFVRKYVAKVPHSKFFSEIRGMLTPEKIVEIESFTID